VIAYTSPASFLDDRTTRSACLIVENTVPFFKAGNELRGRLNRG